MIYLSWLHPFKGTSVDGVFPCSVNLKDIELTWWTPRSWCESMAHSCGHSARYSAHQRFWGSTLAPFGPLQCVWPTIENSLSKKRKTFLQTFRTCHEILHWENSMIWWSEHDLWGWDLVPWNHKLTLITIKPCPFVLRSSICLFIQKHWQSCHCTVFLF